MPILAILSLTRSIQSTGKQVFRDGTDRQTDTHTSHRHSNIETESAQWADAVKITETKIAWLPRMLEESLRLQIKGVVSIYILI